MIGAKLCVVGLLHFKLKCHYRRCYGGIDYIMLYLLLHGIQWWQSASKSSTLREKHLENKDDAASGLAR